MVSNRFEHIFFVKKRFFLISVKESGIREVKDNVCDFIANNGPLVVMGAAAATSFILKKMFG